MNRRAARRKRADATETTTLGTTTEPESHWVVEQEPTLEQDALTAEREERQRRLDYLYGLTAG